MVKVLLFQQFSRQNVVPSEFEPVDTAVISDDAFLVATREGAGGRTPPPPLHTPIRPFARLKTTTPVPRRPRRRVRRTGSVQAYSAGDECVLMHQFFVAGSSVVRLAYIRQLDGYVGRVHACACDCAVCVGGWR